MRVDLVADAVARLRPRLAFELPQRVVGLVGEVVVGALRGRAEQLDVLLPVRHGAVGLARAARVLERDVALRVEGARLPFEVAHGRRAHRHAVRIAHRQRDVVRDRYRDLLVLLLRVQAVRGDERELSAVLGRAVDDGSARRRGVDDAGAVRRDRVVDVDRVAREDVVLMRQLRRSRSRAGPG